MKLGLRERGGGLAKWVCGRLGLGGGGETCRKICFSPIGMRKRSGRSGRRGIGEGFFIRAGFTFGRTEVADLTAFTIVPG